MASPEQTPPVDPSNPPILFRKKRKAGIRQRAASPDDTTTNIAAPTVPIPTTEPNDKTVARSNDDDAQETEQHIPSAIRHRARKRLNGVAFSTTARTSSSDDRPATADMSSSRALVPATSPPSDEPLIAKRFAPQTGLATTIVNKHMMEYIESHLSNRASPSAEATSNTTPQPGGASSASGSTSAAAAPDKEKKVHPIMQGKLMEVDLGDEVRARNQAMTEKAARRLLGEAVPDEDEAGDGGRKAKKSRLGRDGKPWRPRNRRNSDDVKRDRLVEEILRENKLDVYDVPAVQQPQYEGDGDADDRIAEEFRREFMDAMVQRQQKKKATAPPARVGARKADEDVLRGPKLGGSRNSRAAMRDLLLKKEKEGKK
ncbi:hypothetical protein CkaCkLH20_05856 [Colletotrichum karsti]|uniref:mRNA splicing factor RNA helicase n=1 Tax=Colletotrichum karsti TaxID=1095194 RepID=A0A9P6LK75_9PEZI|nr:uncharacterized protein CkaCkLH20_05856 [Colletotrichum karsti]KAF9876448.1 hypothetical protein CkaCkLH20_05856 [Colletotrichum karsti]